MNDIAFSVIINNDGIDDIIFKTIMLKGEKGNSVARVEKTSTSGLVDTYTIYLTDGTIGGTFEVTNGNDINIDDEDVSSSKTWSSQKLSGMIKELDDSVVDADKLWSSAKINSLMPQTATIENQPIASFSDGADDVPVSELIVDIEPVQAGSGVPSPDNVREISGWDECNVTKCGKNLCDWKVNITANPLIIKLPKGTYTISYDSETTYGYWYFRFTDRSGNVVTSNPSQFGLNNYNYSQVSQYFYGGNNRKSVTFILPDEYTITIGTMTGDGSVYAMLETGNTATPYEEYNGGTDTIDFGQTVCGGEIDVASGSGKKLTDIYTVTGEETSVQILQGTNNNGYRIGIPLVGSTNKYSGLLSSVSENANVLNANTWQINKFCTYSGRLYITVPDDYDTVEKALAYLKDGMFEFELATPTPISITSTELKTLLGINNIFADTGNINKLVYFKTGSEAVARMIEAYLRT